MMHYTIRLTRAIRSEPELAMFGLGGKAQADVYSTTNARLKFNQFGAICVRTGPGDEDWLGIKPGEFEWVGEPHPAWYADGRAIPEYTLLPRLIKAAELLLEAQHYIGVDNSSRRLKERIRTLMNDLG